MSRQLMPVMLGLTILPFAAIAVAAYLLAYAGPDVMAIAGAILLLAVCVLLTAVAAMAGLNRVEDWLGSQDDMLRDLALRADRASQRLSELEQRTSYHAMAAEAAAAAPIVPRRDDAKLEDPKLEDPKLEERPAPATPGAPAAAAGSSRENSGEHLALLLEPVIELASGETAHYRALVSLGNLQSGSLPHAELMEKAEQGGMRPALDAHLVRMTAPVLRRLRLKKPGLRVFVPLGKSTLAARAEADAIIALLLEDADVAGGMVFELSQQDIGGLDQAGIENLAMLGRLGATLALRDVFLGGLDLSALRQIGLRYIAFPPHAVDAGNGPSDVWKDFVQYARTMQIQIIVGGIETPQQATAAGKWGRFGHGSFFAPPRKVRRDAGLTAAPHRASAA